MTFVQTDGGRAAAGFKGVTGDCVTRAIAVATGKPYREVYDELHAAIRTFAATSRCRAAQRAARGGGRRGTTPRNGVHTKVYRPYLESLGWVWVPVMTLGSGCTVHLTPGELPQGQLIVRVARHLCAVIDGVVYDNYDHSWGRNRCVYGYFRPAREVAGTGS